MVPTLFRAGLTLSVGLTLVVPVIFAVVVSVLRVIEVLIRGESRVGGVVGAYPSPSERRPSLVQDPEATPRSAMSGSSSLLRISGRSDETAT